MFNQTITTSLGEIYIQASDTHLNCVHFVNVNDESVQDLPNQITQATVQQLHEYFTGQRTHFELPLQQNGTQFQQAVWQTLTMIPYGETWCYADVAVMIGNPKAVRAVGGANNRNQIAIIVPCHRVIGKNGSLVGYAGGLHLKTALLALESAHKLSK